MMPSKRCSSCGAAVRWVRTLAGKSMPLDAEPHPQGNVALDETGEVATVLGKGSAEKFAQLPRYRSHFATCPHAASHRRPKPCPE